MNLVPQIVPITDMRLRHKDVLALLPKGPVILAQHSKGAAVLVSIEQWNAQQKRLQQFELLAEAKQIADKIAADPSKEVAWEETKRKLAAKAHA